MASTAIKLTPHKEESFGKLFDLAIVSCVVFFVLTTAAMLTYSGGTIENPNATHYQFFENPFSDLGRTRLFNGRSNYISMSMFIAGMLGAAVGLAAFFIGFAGIARGTFVTRIFSFTAAIPGIISAICFAGVGCTPWDLYIHLHMHFVFAAFDSLLVAVVLDLIAVLIDRDIPNRLIAPFATFIFLLICYISLLTAGLSQGPAAGA